MHKMTQTMLAALSGALSRQRSHGTILEQKLRAAQQRQLATGFRYGPRKPGKQYPYGSKRQGYGASK